MNAKQVKWKCHLPNLLNEVLNSNPRMGIFSQPFNITGKILGEVAERASQLNDPIMNELMCRLTLYEIADPTSKEYDKTKLEEIERLADKERETK